jgi:hypothetical protein
MNVREHVSGFKQELECRKLGLTGHPLDAPAGEVAGVARSATQHTF